MFSYKYYKYKNSYMLKYVAKGWQDFFKHESSTKVHSFVCWLALITLAHDGVPAKRILIPTFSLQARGAWCWLAWLMLVSMSHAFYALHIPIPTMIFFLLFLRNLFLNKVFRYLRAKGFSCEIRVREITNINMSIYIKWRKNKYSHLTEWF
jgi:hypothetical protein